MDASEKVIIALDFATDDEAIAMVEILGDSANIYKVGLELFTVAGDSVLEFLRATGKKFFLDLKLHDIPNTVKRAASAIAAKGASITTVHTFGGTAMMRAAAEGAAAAGAAKPLVVGVTILTSIDEDTMRNDLRIERSIPSMVHALAQSAKDSGLDGVVASPLELPLLREHFDDSFVVITPGIRPQWAVANDQKRILTPREAFDRGASYIVIGRPVTAAKDPKTALARIHDEIG